MYTIHRHCHTHIQNKDLQFVSSITGYSLCSLHDLLHPTVLTLLEPERGMCGLQYKLPVSILSSYPLALLYCPFSIIHSLLLLYSIVLIIIMLTSTLCLRLSIITSITVNFYTKIIMLILQFLQLTLCVASVATNAQGSEALLGCSPWVVLSFSSFSSWFLSLWQPSSHCQILESC